MFPNYEPPHEIMFMSFRHKMNNEGYEDQWKNIHPCSVELSAAGRSGYGHS